MSELDSLVTELEGLVEGKSITRATEDFPYFLTTYVRTLDEHDHALPTKPIPDKEYIKEIASLMQHEEKLLVEKSRQMMVTWIASAYALWFTMFHEGRRTFIQSKKEKDANATLDRVKFIYRNLPEALKQRFLADEPMPYCLMTWHSRNSVIQAIPQGADVLRQYTASLIISDEMAFQEQAEEAYVASMPTLVGGGQFIGISSPNFKEHFYRLVNDIS